ncbi:ImmA/IrrE family metallo-endopeptidase [Siminovitchia fortis]|uniref:ImmA/IrrE family metallo-endopeptidase n=1 Tax=Siminovitchia fortis TaxID=254758 RepID=UPI00164236DC|nr:ImmA/IrrE family metallo-endopeptidase [Siminovitchia fortis]
MPELTFDDLPEVIEVNKLIASEIHMKVDQYLKNDHPKGWNKIDGAKRFIEQNHHCLIEAPINDLTLGGFIRIINNDKLICYINSAQPRMYQNFVVFHELYHLLYSPKQLDDLHLIEAGMDNRSEERKADYFASLLLLNEHELRSFFTGLKDQKKPLHTKILLCMAAFKAPYKAVLIRMYELNLITAEHLKDFFDKKVNFHDEFCKLGMDPYILEPSDVINFKSLEDLMVQNPLPEIAQTSNLKVFGEIQNYFSSKRHRNE